MSEKQLVSKKTVDIKLDEPALKYPLRLYHKAWLNKEITTAEIALFCNPELLVKAIRAKTRTVPVEKIVERPVYIEKKVPLTFKDYSYKRKIWHTLVWILAGIGGLSVFFTGYAVYSVASYNYGSGQTNQPLSPVVVTYPPLELRMMVQSHLQTMYTPEWLVIDPADSVDVFFDPNTGGLRVGSLNPAIDIEELARDFENSLFEVRYTGGNSFLIIGKREYR